MSEQAIDNLRQVFKSVGAEYVGIQKGTENIHDLVLFNDILTGSTLALSINDITLAKIIVKMADSRVAFNV